MKYISSITVIIDSNWLGEKGSASIAEGLKTNATLTTLDICNNINGITIIIGENQLEDKGAALIAEALKTNTTLTRLSLSNNIYIL